MGFPKILGSLRKAKTIKPISKTIIPAKTIESLPAVVKPITVAEPVVSTVKPAVQGYQIQRFPGYQLKSLMSGNPLEKQLSKTGTISTANIDALSKKMSAIEQSVIGKVLAEKFPGQKAIDYNDFRKGVQDELITYDRTPSTKYENYGIDRLGFKFADPGGLSIAGWDGLTPSTFTFSSPRIPYGSSKHYKQNTLGHSRTYTTADEPDVLHVMESQSDWAQSGDKEFLETLHEYDRILAENRAWLRANKYSSQNAGEELNKQQRKDILQRIEHIEGLRDKLIDKINKVGGFESPEIRYLKDNYTSRQIQENLRYAAEKGQTKMRYPTRETAAKIEGYTPIQNSSPSNEENNIIATINNKRSELGEKIDNLWGLQEKPKGLHAWEEDALFDEFSAKVVRENEDLSKLQYDIEELEKQLSKYRSSNHTIQYRPEHETILKKYSSFPKQFGKLFKGVPVRTTQDLHGNTWYEVDVPKDYLQTEWPFKDGGTIPSIFKNGGILKAQNGLAKLADTIKTATKTSKRLTAAERLGIPKYLRHSPKALTDTYYWGHPQWNATYYKSIADSDDKTTQILRDLHFKLKAPDTKVIDESGMPLHLYHGTSEKEITQLDPSKRGANTGSGFYTDPKTGEEIPIDSENTFSFSSSKNTAISYKNLARWQEIERRRKFYDNIYAAINKSQYTRHTLSDIEKAEQRSFIDNVLSPKLGYDLRKAVNEGTLTDEQKSQLTAQIQNLLKKINTIDDARAISNRRNNLEHDIENLDILNRNRDKILAGESIPDYDFDHMMMSFVSGYGNRAKGEIYTGISKGEDGRFTVSGTPITEESFDELIKNAEEAIRQNQAALSEGERLGGYDTFGSVLNVYMNAKNPLVHDYHFSSFPDIYYIPAKEGDTGVVSNGYGKLVRPLKIDDKMIPTGYIAARQVRKALNSGNDAVVYKNIVDPFQSDTYGIFDPKRVKFSDPITRTDSGEIIPIVKRDNFHNLDLRYNNGGVLKAQKGKVIKVIGEAVKDSSKPALVKYYAPTMGKTFAAKYNPLLVDFDDIIREPSRKILDTYGFKSKSDMYNSGNTDAISAYENMLVEKLNGLRTNPQYNGKTVVVSPTAVANPDKIGFRYDNVPSIPVKSIFIERNVGRGGTPSASEMWYDSLMRQYPGFNIENRFVSELEPMPTNEQWDALYNAAVESGDKKEADRLEQMFYDLKAPGNQTPGITYRGERFPKDAYKFTIGSEQRPGMMFTTTEPALASSYADLYTPYTKVYGLQKQLTGEENMMKMSEELGILTPELKEQWTEKINGIKTSIAEAMKEQPDFSHYRFRRMRIYSTNPEVFDAKGSLWSRVKPYDPELGKIPTTDDLAIAAQKKGHDAMVIQNVRDSGNSTIFFGQNPATDIVALDPNRVKLAGPTYDDDGKLIPLSKRFDFTNPDIRYGIIPLVGLGLGTAAMQQKKNGGIIKGQKGLSKLAKAIKYVKSTPVKYGYASPTATKGNLKQLDTFLEKDVVPRLQKAGHNIKYEDIPVSTIRQLNYDPTDKYLLEKSENANNAGAWFYPSDNTVTLRTTPEQSDYGLLIHEILGHGVRYNIHPEYKPTTREILNKMHSLAKQQNINLDGTNVHIPGLNTADEKFLPIEETLLTTAYKDLFKGGSGKDNLHEFGAVNTQLRGKISQQYGHVTGDELDKIIDNYSNARLMKLLIDQPYTSNGTLKMLSKETGEDIDDLQFMSEVGLSNVIKKSNNIPKYMKRIKDTMKYVAGVTGVGTIAATGQENKE